MLSILQSQFTEKGFKKAKNSEQNVVLLLFLFTLNGYSFSDRQSTERDQLDDVFTVLFLSIPFWS